MGELKKPKDFLETFGAKPWALSAGLGLGQTPDREVEPWMVDFIKQRHSPEAWDAFFDYYNAGPWKRAYCRFMGVIVEILGTRSRKHHEG
jgi:hypothetical protein